MLDKPNVWVERTLKLRTGHGTRWTICQGRCPAVFDSSFDQPSIKLELSKARFFLNLLFHCKYTTWTDKMKRRSACEAGDEKIRPKIRLELSRKKMIAIPNTSEFHSDRLGVKPRLPLFRDPIWWINFVFVVGYVFYPSHCKPLFETVTTSNNVKSS